MSIAKQASGGERVRNLTTVGICVFGVGAEFGP